MKYKDMLLALLLGPILTCSTPSISQAASISDLLITEIMANPSAVSDTNGEWLELFNPTSNTISLDGAFLSDDGGNSHIFSSAGGDLLIGSGNYFILGRNANALINGNYTANYIYGSDFSLTNTSDEIIFSDTSGELLRLNYTAGFITNGASMELLSENMSTNNYAASTSAYGDGDFGSPGAHGTYAFSATPSAVPLPNALWLFGSGLLGLIGVTRRQSA